MRQLSCRQVDNWLALEDRVLEPNPFLSPLFVLPAVQYLTPTADVQAIMIHRVTGTRQRLVGLGVFEVRSASRVLPLPHLKSYQAPGNSFLTGILVDRSCAQEALTAFFQYLRDQPAHWQHLEFDLRTRGTAFGQLLEQVAEQFGMNWIGQDQTRPMLTPKDREGCNPDLYLSRNRRRKYRRSMRSLAARGDVEFDFIRHCDSRSDAVENFLSLEDQGWKQQHGQSFKSSPQGERFFREMSAGFARHNRIFFTELRSGSEVVGSTSNLIAGDSAVAFKSGWATDYADLSIGSLQEVELVRHAPTALSDLECVDSGTGGNSWLASLWPEERTVATGLFAGSAFAAAASRTMLKLRSFVGSNSTDHT